MLDDADFARNPFLVKGYIGRRGCRTTGFAIWSIRVVDGTSWITGADAPGKHVVGLVAGRDFTPDGTIEAAEVRDGDPSPDGAARWSSARGIEIGHIFQLGRKYTDAFTADVLGEDGKPVRLTMGSYGVGVSRLVAVIAEQHHDDRPALAGQCRPFDVHVVIANKDDEARTGATELAAALDRRGLDVLFDDRTASPGVKFKDAELLGVPWIVVVGRGWANGVVELRNRFTGANREIAVDEAVATIEAAADAGVRRRDSQLVLAPGKAWVNGQAFRMRFSVRPAPPTASTPTPRTRAPHRRPIPPVIGRGRRATQLRRRSPSGRRVRRIGRIVDLHGDLVSGRGQRRRDRLRPQDLDGSFPLGAVGLHRLGHQVVVIRGGCADTIP
jgi:hypothetical protein